MLLLKPIYNLYNRFRFLISLPARVVRPNNYARIGLLFVLFSSAAGNGFAQQDCSIPYVIDLTASPNVLYTDPGHVRSGNCDGGSNCISYKILINPGTDVLAISSGQLAASDTYYLNGDGPYPVSQAACVSGMPYAIITFCKPGHNVIAITFSTSAGISTSPDISLRQGCTGTMSVTGMIQSTIQWTSVAPGNPGDYNSYLSTTSGASVVTVTPPAVPPAGGYVDYQVTGIEQSPCNTITKTAIIRAYMYPALNVSLTSSAATVCSGNPVTLTATASGGNPAYTYLWNTGETTPSISVNTAGTYTVQVNDQLSSCGATTKSITITAATPVPPTAPPVTICTGNTATLTATAPGGPYQWYNSAGTLVSSTASYTTPVLTTGTYFYTVMTSFGGCPSSPTLVQVNVLPIPASPTASGATICNGSSATLTASGVAGATYQWYNAAGTLVGSGASYNTGILTNFTTGNYTFLYTVVASNGICSSPPTSVTVTVLPTPAAPTASPVTICNNTTATLTASGVAGASYQWYNSAGTLVSSSASYTTSALTTGTYNYTVTATVAGCISAPTPVTVTVLPTPAAPTASSVTICNNTTAILTATAPGGPYQWYNSAGTLVSSSASYTTPVLTTGTYTYTVMTSFGGCPSSSTTVTVTVLPTPAAPTASSVTICNNTTATLNATAPGGPYQWYNSAGILVSSSASYTTPVLTTGTYTYTVMTSFGGCPSSSTTVTVTVLPTPPPPTASSVTICNNTTATLNATAPGGPYQWYNSAGALVSSNASYTTPVLTTGTYTYTVMTSFGGCPSSSTPVTVTVLPTPAGPTASPVTICNNTTATLTASGAPGTTYQWYNSAGTLVGSGASYTTGTLTTGTYNYTVIGTVGGCPSTPTPVAVTVLPTPPPPTVPPATICDGFTATLTATAPGGPYQWYDSTGTLVGTGTSYTTPVLTTGATNTIYNYTVTDSFGGCPSSTTTVPVTVTPTPVTPTVQSN